MSWMAACTCIPDARRLVRDIVIGEMRLAGCACAISAERLSTALRARCIQYRAVRLRKAVDPQCG